MNTRENDERDRIIRQGKAAWARLKKDKSWEDWMSTGEALTEGREIAMYDAGTNRPEGKGYAGAFNLWLIENKFDDMDPSDRAKLFKVMELRPDIEAWRATLTRTERMKLNHPTTVLRKFEAATKIKPLKPAKPSKDDALREVAEEHHAAVAEVAQLKARVAELEEENASLREQLGPEWNRPAGTKRVRP
ncbi:hypothetical protein [Bradyrhizobium sp. 604_D8_N2_3]|uniref:hypothetical protein n=1 Tax=Bradyrhizobium sp. 604_D8_N2_3 TaxID=3240370 RepID=UPI003F272287